MGTYVQFGCGLVAPDGWLNFDVSPTLRLQRLPVVGNLFKRGSTIFPDSVRFGDIVAGLPIPDGSADGVYASHVLEHLPYDDFWIALRNTYRLLKPGGIFRLIVPDLEIRARNYLEKMEAGATDANSWFIEHLNLGSRRSRLCYRELLIVVFGHSKHLWMWDKASMSAALESSGFVDVRRCQYNDSEDANFRLVEQEHKFRDTGIDVAECAMEARKPLLPTGESLSTADAAVK